MIIQKRRRKVTPTQKRRINIDKQKVFSEYKKFAKRSRKNMFGD